VRLAPLLALVALGCGSRTPLSPCAEGAPIACYPGAEETIGVGQCKAGTALCDAFGSPGACSGFVLPEPELCNATDDDCNGVIDDGCSCDPGAVVPCYEGPPGTAGVGVCYAGHALCGADGKPGACEEQGLPGLESCNGIDDDCDGLVDPACECAPGEIAACYEGPAGTEGVGPCVPGLSTCTADGQNGPCIGQVLPLGESCNGIDDDCDGLVDEDCECMPGTSVSCYDGPPGTEGVAGCQAGLAFCNPDGTKGPCFGQALPLAESCNGTDDDCDGAVDEGVCAMAGLGCADGTREGFVDVDQYPAIAACSGGFAVPGLLSELVLQCNRQGGDDGPLPNGDGCSAEDLCALGFHVCASEQDVADHSPTGCNGSAPTPGLFFVTRQSGPGCGICALGADTQPGCSACQCIAGCLQTDATANDLFGCGSIGDATNECGVLDRFSNDLCSQLPAPWSCGGDGCNEAHALVKLGPGAGGVLCCLD